MRAVLWLFAVGCVAAGLTHVVLGLGADRLLGAAVSAEVLKEPTLSSQNRFYGAAFTLVGFVTALSLGDLPRYAAVLKCTMMVFMLGGIARLIAWTMSGAPSMPVIALMLTELALPPAVLWWLSVQPLATEH